MNQDRELKKETTSAGAENIVPGDDQMDQEPENIMEVDVQDCDPCTLRQQLQEITLIDYTLESGTVGSSPDVRKDESPAPVAEDPEPEPPEPFVNPLN